MNEFDEFKDDSKDLFSSSDNVKGLRFSSANRFSLCTLNCASYFEKFFFITLIMLFGQNYSLMPKKYSILTIIYYIYYACFLHKHIDTGDVVVVVVIYSYVICILYFPQLWFPFLIKLFVNKKALQHGEQNSYAYFLILSNRKVQGYTQKSYRV